MTFGFICLCLIPLSNLRAEDHYFDSNGVKIRYIDEGKGEPVLLIHGFTVNVEMNWGSPGIVSGLAKDYRVIALDNRGHGKSDKPHDPKQYGIEMAEDAIRLLDHLKIDKAHVVGYSMGGMIVAKLLTTHPDRLLSATLGGHGGLREGAKLDFMEQLAKDLDEGKGPGLLFAALTPEGKPRPTAEQLEIMKKVFASTQDEKALAAVVRSWQGLAVADDKLKTCTVPTQAVIGALDPLKKGVDYLPERLPKVKIVVIDGADHMTAPGNPKFLKSIRDFLATQHAGAK
jgi:pimeloyl-ACP methyl ester carboxylesterase